MSDRTPTPAPAPRPCEQFRYSAAETFDDENVAFCVCGWSELAHEIDPDPD